MVRNRLHHPNSPDYPDRPRRMYRRRTMDDRPSSVENMITEAPQIRIPYRFVKPCECYFFKITRERSKQRWAYPPPSPYSPEISLSCRLRVPPRLSAASHLPLLALSPPFRKRKKVSYPPPNTPITILVSLSLTVYYSWLFITHYLFIQQNLACLNSSPAPSLYSSPKSAN